MRRRSSVALPSFGGRRNSSASNSSSIKDELVRDIFHVGLVNLGNSCFYNTIVQSLSATQPLSDIINEAPDSSPALQALSPTSPSYNPDLDALPSPLPMTAALLILLDKLDPVKDSDGARGKKAFNPKGLLRQLSLKHEEYAEATQQDSHELLRHLIDGVMMEEQDLIKKIVQATPDTLPHRPGMHDRNRTAMPGVPDSPPAEPAAAPEASDADGEDSESESDDASSSSSSESEDEVDETALTERQRKQRKLRPFVGTIFEGKLASFIICDECKNVSSTTEDYMDLSLPLKDETGNRMRKRDRIRRTLQAGFFSRKSGKNTSDADDSQPQIKQAPNGIRPERISLSETEGSASASEADETDEDHIRPATLRASGAAAAARSRVHSLDPSQLTRETARSSLRPPEVKGSGTTREPSPLGRALSVLSQGSDGGHHHHHHHYHFHRRPKIPKPSKEQIAYIKKVLVDVPGPQDGSTVPGLPPGLRVARPPGSVQAPPHHSSASTPASSSTDSLNASSASLAKLRLSGGVAPAPASSVDWQNTDLFECFRQFTAVEVLEGENSFACRSCWKWLNPELEAKRKAARDERRKAQEERRAARRAAKKGAAAQVAAGQNGSAQEEEDDDDRDPADRTARNTPAHSPKLVPSLTPLEALPQIQPLESASTPTAVGEGADESAAVTPDAANPTPMRHFSISSAATSNVPSLSTDYELSSEAFETTTDEDEDGSPGLDDAASLSGPLSLKPEGDAVPDAIKLPLTVENVEAAAGGPNAKRASASPQSLVPPAPSAPRSSAVSPVPSTNATKPPPKKQRHILRRAHKRYLISPESLPPVLVVHLKRFMQTSKSSLFGSAFVNLKKRDDPVSFPREMDLSPFLAPAGKPPKMRSPSDAAPSGADSPAASALDDAKRSLRESVAVELEREVHNARYRLYAVVVHFGGLDTGHYASYVLSNRYGKGDGAGQGERRWFFCSDEDVTAVSEAEVLRSKAYMLFYERVPAETSASVAGGAASVNGGTPASQSVPLPPTVPEEAVLVESPREEAAPKL
ncbi:uncharacterized protein JCM10292_004858 [Rhodotorula paludigena]|uniref:uncharacterized protein n=1 Tax=Rhodotorula paludigena TaxID=86838 RepID=UPI003182381E